MSVHPKEISVYVPLSLVITDIFYAHFLHIHLQWVACSFTNMKLRFISPLCRNQFKHIQTCLYIWHTVEHSYKTCGVDTACLCSCHFTSDSCQHRQWPYVPLRRTDVKFSCSHFEDAINIYINFVISTYQQIKYG